MDRVWRNRFEYGLLRGLEAGFGILPRRAADWLGGAIGGFVRFPLGVRREVVMENLARAFPEASREWIADTAAAAYRHLGREATVMTRLASLGAGTVRDLTILTDEAASALRETVGTGRGVIFATGHYGNWEMAAAGVAARGYPITAIVKRMRNPLVDERIAAARRALGVETVGMREAARQVPRALAAGQAVGIVADQDARRTGVWVPFFGIPASTHRGPAIFALRTGAPLLAAIARRLPDGRYSIDTRWIDTRREGDFESDVLRITTELAAALEGEIRADPTQYFWFHKRWKTAPPEEPRPVVPGTTSP